LTEVRGWFRSTFATVALVTACLAPPALTRAEREALTKALRRRAHPAEVRYDTDRIRLDWDRLDMLFFTTDGYPFIVSLVSPRLALAA